MKKKKKLLRNKFIVVWFNKSTKEIKVETVNRKKAIEIEMDFVDSIVHHVRNKFIPRLFTSNKHALAFIDSM